MSEERGKKSLEGGRMHVWALKTLKFKSPRPHCLGLLRDSAFAMLAIFGLWSCGPPWQNPGSAPEITVLMGAWHILIKICGIAFRPGLTLIRVRVRIALTLYRQSKKFNSWKWVIVKNCIKMLWVPVRCGAYFSWVQFPHAIPVIIWTIDSIFWPFSVDNFVLR